MKEESPFTPGTPVPAEFFVGRDNKKEEIRKFINRTISGRQENIFLSGERGIGKSSLASFLYQAARKDLLTIYVSLGGVTSLEELARRVFERILKEINIQERISDKISGFFAKYVKQIDLFGISLSFDPPKEDLENILSNFSEALKNIIDKIKDDKKGIFIILDDINGVSRTSKFANWYKSFVDSAAIHYPGNFPVFMMLIGLPEIRDTLSKRQPSLMRIFRVMDIDKLSDDEVKDFLKKAFNKVNIKVEPQAMSFMVMFSSGLPALMHEIGDAVYWIDEDGVINKKDAISGIKDAADRIGKKYLDPKIYRAVRSKRYRSILRKLGEEGLLSKIRKKEIESKLNTEERRVFNNFLRKMESLNVIVQDVESGRGSYKFVNELYPVYIWMENQKLQKK